MREHRLHLVVLASLAPVTLALIVAAPGCSDDSRSASHKSLDAGRDAAHSPDATVTPVEGGSGSGGAPGAGDGGAPAEGDGPRTGSGGSGAAGKPSGAGGAPTGPDAGCEPMDVPDAAIERELLLCGRLRSASVLSFDATRAYDHAVYADCRVSWVIDLYLKEDMRAQFLNSLLVWNMHLWGCTPPPPTDFGLVFKPTPLSAGDVAALVDDYMGVVTPALDLSDLEIADMRAALLSLARPLIEDSSCGYSRSSCVVEPGAGGAGSGGAMGAGGAANGGAMSAGGEPGAGGTTGSGGSGGTETGGSGEGGSPGPTDAGTPDAGPPRTDSGPFPPSDASAGGRDAASPP